MFRCVLIHVSLPPCCCISLSLSFSCSRACMHTYLRAMESPGIPTRGTGPQLLVSVLPYLLRILGPGVCKELCVAAATDHCDAPQPTPLATMGAGASADSLAQLKGAVQEQESERERERETERERERDRERERETERQRETERERERERQRERDRERDRERERERQRERERASETLFATQGHG